MLRHFSSLHNVKEVLRGTTFCGKNNLYREENLIPFQKTRKSGELADEAWAGQVQNLV
jgi:hypothetical protein